jgi:hypothetical protein
LFFSGITHLWPLPPSLPEEMHALFLWVAAMVFLTMGEFVACHLAMLSLVSKNPKDWQKVRNIERQTFSVFRDGVAAIKNIYEGTINLTRGSNIEQRRRGRHRRS